MFFPQSIAFPKVWGASALNCMRGDWIHEALAEFAQYRCTMETRRRSIKWRLHVDVYCRIQKGFFNKCRYFTFRMKTKWKIICHQILLGITYLDLASQVSGLYIFPNKRRKYLKNQVFFIQWSFLATSFFYAFDHFWSWLVLYWNFVEVNL